MNNLLPHAMDCVIFAGAASVLLAEIHARAQNLLDTFLLHPLTETISPRHALVRAAKVLTGVALIIGMTRILSFLVLQLLWKYAAVHTPPTINNNHRRRGTESSTTYFLYPRVSYCHTPGICTVCLEENHNDVRLQCGHTFHWECVRPWLDRKSVCPLCKAKQFRIVLP